MGCYFFANIRITDEALYQKYLDACDAVFAKYHGKYLAVDKAPRVLEGLWNYSRTVLIYFKTETDFNAWYASPDYQAIRRFRLDGADCDTILIRDLDGMPSLKRVGVADPGFLELVGELDAELRETYPVLQDAYDKLNTLSAEALVVLLYADGLPVACGCVRPYANSTWEVKRMFVRKDYRGKGFSRKVLGELEAWAAEMGGTELILETGVKQLAAISLYEESGFLRMDNYGEYEGNENSVCMKKVL